MNNIINYGIEYFFVQILHSMPAYQQPLLQTEWHSICLKMAEVGQVALLMAGGNYDLKLYLFTYYIYS